MAKIIVLIPFQEQALNHWIIERALGARNTLKAKAAYLEKFKKAIRRKYAAEDFVVEGDEHKIELLASTFLDSIQFAGGVAIPAVLQSVLAVTHMADSNKPDDLKGLTLNKNNYVWILLETLRKYAPVAGVQFWEEHSDGSFRHIIPNVAQALMDSSIFKDPLSFKHRDMALYQSTIIDAGMPWAGLAVQKMADGSSDSAAPHSHNCPVQQLSFKIMKVFLEALMERGATELDGSTGWSAIESSAISLTLYSPSDFTLLKRGLSHTTGCEVFPACKAGYSWVSTKDCSWAERDWTCKVP